jgi:class 3 adenylate cyclase
MEPRIQYTQTKDGVSIAYGVMGAGRPLVVCPSFIVGQLSHVLQSPTSRGFFDHLAKDRLLVMYDSRGFGLSERNVTDFSLEARALDLEAVVRAARLRRLALWASFASGPIAVAFTASHRREVTHLILYGTTARGAEVMARERIDALTQLCRTNWDLAAQVLADMSLRDQYPEEGVETARVFRDSISGEVMAEWLNQAYITDVRALLPQISAPTLVLHRRGDAVIPIALGQKLAAALPNARFVPLEGTVFHFALADSQAVLDAVTTFLEEGRRPTRRVASMETGPVTILFTDVEGSTALTQRLGDTEARALLREHERTVRKALKSHGGSEVKTMGDGFMASFSSATKALECAIAMQRAFAEQNESAEEPILVRVGLNAGEPIAEDDDLFGTAVNLAARICSHAEAGQILAPIVVRELAAGKQFLFADLGETELRGFEDPVRLYEVRWREE